MNTTRKILIRAFGVYLIFTLACSSSTEPPPPPPPPDETTVEEIIAEGWALFEAGNYPGAVQKFQEAKNKDRGKAEAYTGLGWSHLKNGNPASAESELSFGASQNGADADLFGGWAFTLNALQRYADSNTQIDRTLTENASWAFSHGSSVTADDLTLLRAGNHFLLGNFSDSLSAVQQLNAAFDADVATSDGQAALAAEIERLRSET